MQEEINQLKREVEQLTRVVNYFTYPDRYQFERTVGHRGIKLGFFGVDPVVQQTPVAVTSSMTTNGGTTVTESNGFSGNFGSTFHTIGDIVAALKKLGLLKK